MLPSDSEHERNSKPDKGFHLGAYLALGGQLAGIVGLGLLAGYALDQKFSWSPWGMCAGGSLGTLLGLYYFLKAAQ